MKNKITILNFIFFIFSIFISISSYSQYSISGYLKTNNPNKTIYLSLLRFDEENSQYENQIVTNVKTDSLGFFKIKGILLSEQDKFYRIYANLSETSLDFVRDSKRKNYHNFIFSNNDSIFFQKNNSDFWFSNSSNTNLPDKEWTKIIKFENQLKNELIEPNNPEAKSQIKASFLKKYKTFCNDSIKSPLVKLLAYSSLKKEVGQLNDDFQKDPNFYYEILTNLKKEYGNSSYYLQFKDEITQLSLNKTIENYNLSRYLNYFLIFIILTLTIFLLKVIKDKNKLQNQEIFVSNLTKQEQKITELITKGKSNKEIASELFISLSTVKTHITNINSKLNVGSRQQIIKLMKNKTKD